MQSLRVLRASVVNVGLWFVVLLIPNLAEAGGFVAVPAARLCVPGEEHTYDVLWGVIPLGVLRARCDEKVVVNGNPAFHISVYADSHPWLLFLSLHELFESWIDASEVFCRKEIAHIDIGSDKSTETYTFDCGRKKLHYDLRPVGKPMEEGDVDMTCPSQDLVSFAYVARALSFTPGVWEASLSTLVHAEMKETVLRSAGIRQTVKVAGGDRPAVLVTGDARYKTPEGFTGRFRIWLSDDDLRIPLRGQLKIVLGWITIEYVR